MTSILFIVPTFEIGGIELFISRLAKVLKFRHQVGLLVLSDRIEPSLLRNSEISVYRLEDYAALGLATKNNPFLNSLLNVKKEKLTRLLIKYSFIHCVDSTTLTWCIQQTVNLGLKKCKVTAGVYHSKEYLWEMNYAFFRKVQQSQFSRLNRSNVYIANVEAREKHLHAFKESEGEYSTFPFGVDLSSYKEIHPKRESKKIRMIGRFVDFKNYQVKLIENFIELGLSDRGFELHYHGFGPNQKVLTDAAGEMLGRAIFFHGKTQPEHLPCLFADSYLFVGGGLTIIESAAAGVPAVVGIESEPDNSTYGFFCEIKGDSFNRNDLGLTKYNFKDFLGHACELTEDEYQSLVNRHKDKSSNYAIEKCANEFSRFLSSSAVCNPGKRFPNMRYSLSKVFWFGLNMLRLNDRLRRRYHK